MATNGLLFEVRWEWDGTQTTADLAAGATVLPVLVATAISVDETVWINFTGPYTVTDADEENDTITISPGLTAAYEAGTEVVPDVGGQPAQVWVAEVGLPDSDTPIEVPLTVHDLSVMPEGVYDPPVAIIITDDLMSVVDLPGSLPVVDGAYVPPSTLPPPPVTGNSIYRQTDQPWPDGDATGHPDNTIWYDSDDNNKPWLWDEDNHVWVDASDPRTDVLDNPDDIVINDGTATI